METTTDLATQVAQLQKQLDEARKLIQQKDNLLKESRKTIDQRNRDKKQLLREIDQARSQNQSNQGEARIVDATKKEQKKPREGQKNNKNQQQQETVQKENVQVQPFENQKETNSDKQWIVKDNQEKGESEKPVEVRKRDFMTETTFDSLQIHNLTKKALREIVKYEFLTKVQQQTLPVALTGVDMIAQAKTGTGKTSAFLLPSIQKLIQLKEKGFAGQGRKNNGVSVVIVSPTRELANQIAKEAKGLLHFHPFQVVTFVGGLPLHRDIKALQTGIDLLVATPGRMIDHLKNTKGFASLMNHIKVFVLDEADQMLEMGFKPAIKEIISFLPKDRQTLLFSATVPPSLIKVANIAVKPDYKFINTIPVNEQQTHKKVPQECQIVKFKDYFLAIFCAIQSELKRNPSNFKIMVFLGTTGFTSFMADFYRQLHEFPVIELHSKKSQDFREKQAKIFASTNKNVLFTSDVSARGVDYPDVTLIIQVGATERDPYIHRVGRTARASGIEGRGILILSTNEEKHMASVLNDLPLQYSKFIHPSENDEVKQLFYRTLSKVQSNPQLMSSAQNCYKSYLRYMSGWVKKLGWNKQLFAGLLMEFAQMINAVDNQGNPVPLKQKMLAKLGLDHFGIPMMNGAGPKRGGHGGGRQRY